MNRSRIGLVVAASVLPLALAACSTESTSSSSSDSGWSSESASPSASPSPSASGSTSPSSERMEPDESGMIIGGDPATWTPIEVTMADNGFPFDVQVGQRGNFVGLPVDDATNNIVVESSNPEVVEAVEGDGTTSLPGFIAVAPGTATLTVVDGFMADKGDAEVVMQVTINVK